jgi:hypothetical protein
MGICFTAMVANDLDVILEAKALRIASVPKKGHIRMKHCMHTHTHIYIYIFNIMCTFIFT